MGVASSPPSSRSRCRSTGCASRPGRTSRHNYFDERAVDRGQMLYANSSMPSVQRRAVAAVRELPRHRRRRRPATAVIDPDGRRPEYQSSWKAPPLNTELLRFTPTKRSHADHHLRPAGHADAGLGRAAAARRTTRRSATSSRTSSSIQLTPEQAQKAQAKNRRARRREVRMTTATACPSTCRARRRGDRTHKDADDGATRALDTDARSCKALADRRSRSPRPTHDLKSDVQDALDRGQTTRRTPPRT